MKNKILLICAALILFIFLVFGTYAWYIFFLRSSGNLDILNNSNLRYGDIVFKDDGISVYDEDALSIEDIKVSSVIPYKFRVINEGNKDGDYTLYIEDLPVNAINDVFITFTRTSGSAVAKGALPMNLVTIIVTITILIVWPMDLIVAKIDEATP